MFVLLCTTLGFSQPELSENATISLLTVGTADELHSKFGHSAIRIKDSGLGIDVIYNYGHFDFNTPNFYVKFTQGKLLYELSRNSYSNFMYGYEIENRWVKEQVFNFTQKQKNDFFKFLEKNYLPENRYYKYDFLFDNCSTRIPDALKTVLGDELNFDYSQIENQYTFRELLHQNLNTNSWATFGIDLALGSVIDREATFYEQMFLPIYVFKQLPYTTINNTPVVTKDVLLLNEKPREDSSIFLLSPLFWVLTILLIVALITYRDYNKQSRNRSLDFLLFFITGIAGLLILFLWFGTDHKATGGNYNFLWTFPLNLIVAFTLLKKEKLPNWLYFYLIGLGVLLLIAIVLWVFKVQVFNILIIPILLALIIRYSFLFYMQRSA
ncbi:DUF4105 domain-containing protein [Cellulophaga sp. HaHaR_3_176]|uniref:lipoprotein N-acyltransferase Lnb domain-containing protein n=1 Tax=Cellulophaga sp. HaHaR_3_176 TaxID=1942464 RepID=UPI0020B11C2E|nr:DUF4105 domain-containing protein [Cellulophaga sp. HaHaR_3_176]